MEMDYFQELQAEADRYKHLYEIFKDRADKAEKALARARAEDEIERLRDEREQLALAICGGEDAPGFANAQTVEKLVEIAEQSRREVAQEYQRTAADRADAIAARAQARRYRDALYRIAGGTNYADDPWDIARFALATNEKSPDR